MFEHKNHVVVYGITAEGYELYLNLLKNGLRASFIDERAQSVLDLQPPLPTDFSKFLEQIDFVKIAPVHKTLSHAEHVFLTQLMRTSPKEYELYKSELASALKPVLKFGAAGASVISMVPATNKLWRSTLTREDLSIYHLYNLPHLRKKLVGALRRNSRTEEALRKLWGDDLSIEELEDAEITFLSESLKMFSQWLSESISLARAKSAPLVHELLSPLPTLRLINSEVGHPFLQKLLQCLLKHFEEIPRIYSNELRRFFAEENLKPSRAKIFLVWTAERWSINQEAVSTRLKLFDNMRNLFAKVELVSLGPAEKTLFLKKVKEAAVHHKIIIIACSSRDIETVKPLLQDGSVENFIFRATIRLVPEGP